MRLIVLGAGQGFKLDGFNKLLIPDPATRETALERFVRLFPGWELTFVVGFRAIEVMSRFPDLDYVYNDDWSITGNSYSLSLALDQRPAVVVSSDIFFDEPMVELLGRAPDNAVLCMRSENQQVHSVRCVVDGEVAVELYAGAPRRPADRETIGIYKVSDEGLLREWRRRCSANRGVFCGINLPLDGRNVVAVDKGDLFFHEVNTHLDYLNLIGRRSGRS